MELLTLYHAVAEQLDRLDFAALYPGYHRYPFALYDEEQVCLEGQLFPRQYLHRIRGAAHRYLECGARSPAACGPCRQYGA